MNLQMNLSDEGAEILMALFASINTPPAWQPSTEQLVAFCLGFLDEADEIRTLKALTDSSILRARLLAVRQELNVLADEPLAGQHEPGTVASYLRKVISDALRIYSDLSGLVREQPWKSLVTSAGYEGKLMRGALATVGATLKGTMSSPLYAAYRSSAAEYAVLRSSKSDLEGTLLASIGESGNLSVEFACTHRTGEQLPELAFELADPAGGALPLGVATDEDGLWRVELTDFAQFSGLEPGPIPAGAIRVREPSGMELESSDRLRRPMPESIRLSQVPYFEDGDLVLSVDKLPAQPEPEIGLLVARLRISDWMFKIGEWKLRDISDSGAILRVPVAGASDGPLSPASLLQLTIESLG